VPANCIATVKSFIRGGGREYYSLLFFLFSKKERTIACRLPVIAPGPFENGWLYLCGV